MLEIIQQELGQSKPSSKGSQSAVVVYMPLAASAKTCHYRGSGLQLNFSAMSGSGSTAARASGRQRFSKQNQVQAAQELAQAAQTLTAQKAALAAEKTAWQANVQATTAGCQPDPWLVRSLSTLCPCCCRCQPLLAESQTLVSKTALPAGTRLWPAQYFKL